MRLYIKLLAMIVSIALVQRFLLEHGEEWWFVARCQVAQLSGDETMKAKLIDEAREELIRNLDERFDPAIVFAAASR